MATAHHSRTFAQRIGYHWTYVASATILSDEILETSEEEHPQSLRAEASAQGLCFLRIMRYLPHAGLFHGQVAATPKLLQTQPLDAFFTEEQLCGILPYDCRLQQRKDEPLPPATLLARLSAHAKACHPATRVTP